MQIFICLKTKFGTKIQFYSQSLKTQVYDWVWNPFIKIVEYLLEIKWRKLASIDNDCK